MNRILTALLVLMIPTMGFAVDYYAHPTVNDDSDCVCEATGAGAGPCSAQKVVDCAAAGSTVYFETGIEYDLTVPIDFDVNSGTSTNLIKYTTPNCDIYDDSTYAVWDGQGIAANCWAFEPGGKDYWYMSCQEFKNAISRNVKAGATNAGCYVHGVVTHNSGERGMFGPGIGSYLNIRAYSNGDLNIIIGSYSDARNIFAYDAAVSGGMYIYSYTTLSNSVSYGNLGYGLSTATSVSVHNCGFYDNSNDGILINGNPAFKVTDSIIEGSGHSGLCATQAGFQVYSDHNVLYNNTGANYENVNPGPNDICTENGNAPSSSQFVDAPNADFSLVVSAEARGAGMPVLCPDCSKPSVPSSGAWEDAHKGARRIILK